MGSAFHSAGGDARDALGCLESERMLDPYFKNLAMQSAYIGFI